MTDGDLWSAWRIWMGVATVVVLIAATLLVIIWLTARRILADAVRALTAAEAIRAPRRSRSGVVLAWASSHTARSPLDQISLDRWRGSRPSPSRPSRRTSPAPPARLLSRTAALLWAS